MDVERQAGNDVGLKGDSERPQNVIDDSKEWEGYGNEPNDDGCSSRSITYSC